MADTHILRVNLTNKSIRYEPVPEDYRLLGGRALTSKIIYNEVLAGCEPLGEYNKLVFAPGLLGGIAASSVHRLSVGSKSPLTDGIKESNSGGNMGLKLARLKLKAVIIEGKSNNEELFILEINNKNAYLRKSSHFRGLKASDFAKKIHNEYGNEVAFSIIGPAGERGLRASTIINTDKDGVPARFSARGGLGAVMGMKGLKAIIVDTTDSEPVEVKDRNAFKSVIKRYSVSLQNNFVISNVYRPYGTAAMLDFCNEIGGLPTRNFSTGKFEHADKINANVLRDTIIKRGGDTSHACVSGCIIKCSNIYPDKNGNPILRSFEYETIAMCGSNCGISDLDDIANINKFCNEFGLDTIEIGASLGLAMEAKIINFGDISGVQKILKEIKNDSVLGRVIGNGAALTGRVLGVTRIPVVKNQAMPAYDPRAIKGHGVTYATSPMGADHTAGMNIREKLDPHSPKGQVESSQYEQLLATLYDSLGFCLFVNPAVRDDLSLMVDLVNSVYGISIGIDDLWEIARKTLRNEVDFNRACGLTKAYDSLPEIFLKEKLPSSGLVFDVPLEDLEKLTEW